MGLQAPFFMPNQQVAGIEYAQIAIKLVPLNSSSVFSLSLATIQYDPSQSLGIKSSAQFLKSSPNKLVDGSYG